MTLERKLTLGVLGLFLPPTGVAGLAAVLLYWHGIIQEPPALLAVGVIGLALMMLYLGVVAHGLGRSLVRAIEQLRHGAELMATVNPEHRLDVRTGDELQALAAEINRLAEYLRTARQGLDERVALATRELEAERGVLSAILGELAEGVVVANRDGRVTLANRAAGRLLHDRGAVLGRDLFEPGRSGRAGPPSRGPAPGRERGRAIRAADHRRDRPAGGDDRTLELRERDDQHDPHPARTDARRQSPFRDRETARPSGRERLPDRLHGVGLHSGTSAGVPGPARPELYDFSLFDEMEPRARSRRA